MKEVILNDSIDANPTVVGCISWLVIGRIGLLCDVNVQLILHDSLPVPRPCLLDTDSDSYGMTGTHSAVGAIEYVTVSR